MLVSRYTYSFHSNDDMILWDFLVQYPYFQTHSGQIILWDKHRRESMAKIPKGWRNKNIPSDIRKIVSYFAENVSPQELLLRAIKCTSCPCLSTSKMRSWVLYKLWWVGKIAKQRTRQFHWVLKTIRYKKATSQPTLWSMCCVAGKSGSFLQTAKKKNVRAAPLSLTSNKRPILASNATSNIASNVCLVSG